MTLKIVFLGLAFAVLQGQAAIQSCTKYDYLDTENWSVVRPNPTHHLHPSGLTHTTSMPLH